MERTYQMVKKRGDVPYEVEIAESGGAKTFHANFLKRRHDSEDEGCYVNIVEESEEIEEYQWEHEPPKQRHRLMQEEKCEAQQLLQQYPTVIAKKPGPAKNTNAQNSHRQQQCTTTSETISNTSCS